MFDKLNILHMSCYKLYHKNIKLIPLHRPIQKAFQITNSWIQPGCSGSIRRAEFQFADTEVVRTEVGMAHAV